MSNAKKLDIVHKIFKKFIINQPTFQRVAEKCKPIDGGNGRCVCEFTVEEQYENPMGTLHGGCTMTLVDILSTVACLTEERAHPGVSVDLNISLQKSSKRFKMVSGLVPARFLILTAHLVLTIAIFWSRDENVLACLPSKYSSSQYESKDTQFIIALSISLVLFALEYFGFFAGISTFMPSAGLISTAVHAAACITLAFFIWDVWPCDFYWFIFVFCALLPGVVELIVIVGVLGLKKHI